MKHSIIEEKIQIIFKFVHYTIASGIIGSIAILFLALHATSPRHLMIGSWFGVSSLNFLVRYLAFVRSRHLSPEKKVLWSTRARWHLLVSGSIWGTASLLFIPTLTPPYQVAFIIVLLGLNITSIPLMSDAQSISMLFIPAWAPTAYTLYSLSGSVVIPLSILFTMGYVYLVAFIVKKTLDEFITVKLQRDEAVAAPNDANVRLQNTNATQMSFFLAASHDFRQPLQSMRFYLMIIKKRLQNLDKDLSNIVAGMENTFENLNHLIDETINFAKISISDQTPIVETISVKKLIEPLIANFQYHATTKGLRFHVHCGSDFILQSNTQILKRILDNLITNALRNTQVGGILVAFRRRGKNCSIQVWDTGVGIPAYERERVFDAFYQGVQNKEEAKKGYGLGLMIVKRLCERISAELTLSSRLYKGTVFRLQVPLACSSVFVRDKYRFECNANLTLKGLTIAIVDDDHGIRDSLKAFLSDTGATVIDAPDRTSLRHALQGINEVHLLLTDLHLNNDLGDDIAAEVHTLYPMCKSIILTGDASPETQARLKDHVVLLKPVTPDLLMAHITQTFGLSSVFKEVALA